MILAYNDPTQHYGMGDNLDEIPDSLAQDLIAAAESPGTPDPIMSDTMLKKAAALAATGSSRNAISKALKISPYYVNRIFRDDQFQKYLTEIGDDAILHAKVEMRTAISKLSKKAIAAIDKNLAKHSLEAAKVVLRTLGLDGTQKEEGADKNGGLTLVLASQPAKPQDIVVVDKKDTE